MRTESKLRFVGMLLLAAALLLPAGRSEACDCSVLPTLGRAFEYPAFGFGKDDIVMSGSAFADNGNIGLASGDKKVALSGGSTIDGYIHHHAGTSLDLWSPAAAGSGTAVKDLDGARADAISFANIIAALPATQTEPEINNDITFNGNGCVNIIEIKGDVTVGSGKKITLNGGPDDYFLFNVYGSVNFSGDSSITLTGGVTSNHVVFNVRIAGKNISISGDSAANATFITETGKLTASGGGSSLGAFYADGCQRCSRKLHNPKCVTSR